MKALKSVFIPLLVLLAAQTSHAGRTFKGSKCDGTLIRNTSDLAKNDSRAIPDFLRHTPVTLVSGGTRLVIRAELAVFGDMIIQNGKKEWKESYRGYNFTGEVNSVFVGKLFVAQICISGNDFRMDLENNVVYHATIISNGDGLNFQGKDMYPAK